MKKSRIALIVCIIAVLALICIGGWLVYVSLMNPSMAGFIVWEYEDVPNKDEPYTTVDLTEEIHKEYIGKTMECLVDGTDKEFLTARTEGGRLVRFMGDESLIGNYAKVTITGATTWSLTGKLD